MLTTHKWWCTGFVTRNRISSILIVSSKSWHIPAQPDKLENCSGMLKTWVRIPLCQQKNNPIAQLVQSNSLTWNRSSVRTRLGLQISSLAQRKSGCFTCNRSWVQSPQELQKFRFLSSVGSVAFPLHGRGRRFESYRNHNILVGISIG